MCAGMKIGAEQSGMGIEMPGSCDDDGDEEEDSVAVAVAVLEFVARRALAEGLARVKVRIAEITADVRFSRSYSAEELVADGWRVAAWGLILGRVAARKPPPVALVPAVATLAVSDVGFWVVVLGFEIVGVDGVVLGSVDDGCTMPVNAVQMSAIGGSASTHGMVNKGLSQRLCVLGSS